MSIPNAKEEVTFLLVDDDETDREMVRRSFKKEKVANPIIEAKDGIEALEKLRGEGGQDQVPYPYIILLDLKMPRMNGIEFLEELRKDPKLKSSVVFVMTSSNAHTDKIAAYNFNVAGYIIKGELYNGLTQLVLMLDHYWKIVQLPPKST